MTTLPTYQIPAAITTALSTPPTHCTVLMTCGISGSGKSTLSHALTSVYSSFTRLSIDNYIFSHHGIYAVDYPISAYEKLQSEAEAALKEELRVLLREGVRDLVLDFSFWCRGVRDEYRELVMKCGGGKYRVVLVYFDASEDVLWERIEGRRRERKRGEGDSSDSACVVTREMLRGFVRGFEVPRGEGEIVIKVG